MSKLSDQIKKATGTAPSPMGFAAVPARTAAPTMLCLVRLGSGETGKIAEAAEKGAAVVIVDNPDAGKLKSGVEKAGAIVGARLDKAQREDVRKLREAGADFVVLDADTAMADAALEEKIGFVLPVSLDAEDADLRLIGDLPLDALIVPGVDGRLTLRAALRLRRVAALARTPLLTEVDAGIDASSAQVLRESGVVGLIVDGASIGKLGKLRETIGALPPRGRRREEHHEATIPAGVTGGDEDEDDDWDDD